MSKTITFEELQALIAPAQIKDLDGSFEIDAPKGFVSTATGLHWQEMDYKSKWFKKNPFQTDEEWEEMKKCTPTRLQALKAVLADWPGLMPCDIGPECDNCFPDEEE